METLLLFGCWLWEPCCAQVAAVASPSDIDRPEISKFHLKPRKIKLNGNLCKPNHTRDFIGRLGKELVDHWLVTRKVQRFSQAGGEPCPKDLKAAQKHTVLSLFQEG